MRKVATSKVMEEQMGTVPQGTELSTVHTKFADTLLLILILIQGIAVEEHSPVAHGQNDQTVA